ncbi:MAG: peptidylprolyl isomerase [Bacteroidales bacterium]|nr:peptidylprolyl isomerase [Bacteroidales bacterium]
MVTSMGSMKIKLYKETPLHRDNFVKLARKGYYNGLLFHRVIKGFMIQAGDPFTRDTTKVELYGSGGPNYTIPAEIVPGLHHKKGAIAAARRGDSVNPERASSGSQFYIVQDEEGCSHLDGEYTIFGEVTDGMNVIDNIAGVETNPRGLPLYPINIISIKEIK